MPPTRSDVAPRGVALELAASATLDTHGSTSANSELEEVKAELKKWVAHSLHLDNELTKSELRIKEKNDEMRRFVDSHASVRSGHDESASPSSSKGSERNPLSWSNKMSESSDTDRTSQSGSVSRHRSPHVLANAGLLGSLPAGRSLAGLQDGRSLAKLQGGPDMIRLLLVEDDPFQADAILALCEQCRYNTQVASSAAEALDLVRAHPEINLVLSDVMMEGISGYDLLCRIRAIRSHVSVIMLSAYESIDLVQQCILSGADAYLLKPLRVHELTNIWQYVWR